MKDITKTPIKLYAQVARGLSAKFRQLIEEHGLTFAVNSALADHLRSLGVSVAAVETPTDKMAKAQRARWRNVSKAKLEAEQEAEAKKEARRERDRARKAAEQSATTAESGD